jgi:hypothetical protein
LGSHPILYLFSNCAIPSEFIKHTKYEPQFNNKQAFEKNFIYEVSRKFHPIIKRSTEGIGQAFKNTLLPNLPNDTIKRIDTFFKVKSSIHAWLK